MNRVLSFSLLVIIAFLLSVSISKELGVCVYEGDVYSGVYPECK